MKQEFKLQLKKYIVAKLSGDKEKANQTGAIILTIIAAVGLTFLLSALVCELSCSGADAAAVIIGILGLAGIIWGTIAFIKYLKRKQKKKAAATNVSGVKHPDSAI